MGFHLLTDFRSSRYFLTVSSITCSVCLIKILLFFTRFQIFFELSIHQKYTYLCTKKEGFCRFWRAFCTNTSGLNLKFYDLIFSYCKGIPSSQVFEDWITAWRSSIFFAVTLTRSSLIEACTFKPASFICFTIFLASSCLRPFLTVTSFFHTLPLCDPSFDRSKASGAIPCLCALLMSMSINCRIFISSSVSIFSLNSFLFKSITTWASLKSKRLVISFLVTFTALSSSWASTLLTISNEGIVIIFQTQM